MGTKRFVHVLSLSALALAFAVPAAASADTIKIGSSLTDPWTADALTGGTGTGVQISQGTPTSPLSLTAPADGTITSWSVKAGTMNILYALRVLHPNGGDSFTPTATATAPSVIPATSPDGVVYTYPASVPVQKGDQIGVDENTGGLPTYQSMATLTANDVTGYAGTAVNGTPTSFLTVGGDHYELLLQAEMKVCKVPDVVGKSQPDAGAALAAADCAAGTVTSKTVTFKKKKVHGKKARAKQKAKLAAARALDGKVISATPGAGTVDKVGTSVGLVVNKLVISKKHKKK